MTTFIAATKNVETSDRINEYLAGRTTADDTVYVVNSQEGGEQSSSDDIRGGTEAIDTLVDGLAATVETHQFVRGNDPAEDILAAAEEYDADEILIAIRKRNPTGKIVFGSTAQDLLLSTRRPVVAIPLETDR
ncbi:universal stress protein [Halomarina rubra]|uniref:Universal stress protein n=1 Tax=Halomarina rubra TaxID=2071873 RepID=A0ABD6AXN9_9EURY|nr:universal stress protein [Halomarina rubra]